MPANLLNELREWLQPYLDGTYRFPIRVGLVLLGFFALSLLTQLLLSFVRMKAVRQFADRHGLKRKGRSPEGRVYAGWIRDRQVTITAGRAILITVRIPGNVPAGFSVRTNSLPSAAQFRTWTATGEMDEAFFKQYVSVRGSKGVELADYLTPGRAAALRRVLWLGKIEVSDGEIRFRKFGGIRKGSRIDGIVGRMVETANRLEKG